STSTARIAAVTSAPSTSTRPFTPKETGCSSASSASASPSETTAPSRCATQVSARYMAPVSRYRKPSRRASIDATVLFPEPAGPSIATIMSREGSELPQVVARPRSALADLGHVHGAGRDLLQDLVETGKARGGGLCSAQLDALARRDARDRAQHGQAMVS